MKKGISILVILTLLLSLASTAFAKPEVLVGLGIAEKMPQEGEYITREEFAVLLSNIAGFLGDETARYPDTGKSKNNNAINSAVAQELMFPYEDGTFRPYLELTYTSAIRSAVCLTGYGPLVSREGDVDGNFRIQASALGLLKGISQEGDYITKAQAYKLIYNTLAQEYMSYAYLGNGLTPARTGKSVLSYFKKVERIDAVLQAVGDTALSGVTAPGGHRAVAGGEVMNVSDKLDLTGFFGYKCEIYYDVSDGEKTIVFVTAEMEKQQMVKLYPSDNISYNETERKLVYQPDPAEKEFYVKLNIATDIFVNGSLNTEQPLREVFDLSAGSITVIDYNTDGQADVVLVSKMDTYVINSVNTKDQKLTVKVWPSHDSAWKTEVIDLSDIDDLKVIDMQGYARELSEIKEWDVVSVMLNRDLDQAVLYCAFESVMGTIDGITEGNDTLVTVNGKEYSVAKEYYGAYGQGIAFDLGATVTLKLDIDGNVFCQIKNLAGSGTLGYVIGYYQEDSLLEGNVRMRILCEDGVIRDYDVEDATVNDLRCKDSTSVKNALDANFDALNSAAGAKIAKIILFETKGENEIRKITIPTVGGDEEALRPFPLRGTYGYRDFMRRSETLEGIYTIASDAKVFVLPVGSEETIASADPSEFSVKQALGFLADSQNSYLQAFKLSRGSYGVDILVTQKGGDASITSDTPMQLIQAVNQAVNTAGDPVHSVRVLTIDPYGNKKENQYYTKDESVLSGYETGDVAQFIINEKGEITYASPVFYVTEPGTGNRFVLKKRMWDDGQWNNYSESSKVLFASVYAKENTTLIVNKGAKVLKSGSTTPAVSMESFAAGEAAGSATFFDNMFVYNTSAVPNILLFDSQGKKQFVNASDGDIIDYKTDSENYSKALIYQWWGGCRFIILYR